MCKSREQGGVRCSDHSQKRITKIGEHIHNLDKDINETQTLINDLVTEHGDQVDQQSIYTALITRKTRLTEQQEEFRKKLEDEKLKFATTAAGRKWLKERAEDETLNANERLEAAAMLQAAKERIIEQKRVAAILNSTDLTDEDKQTCLELENEADRQTIQQLTLHLEHLTNRNNELKKEYELAEVDDDKELMRQIKKQMNLNAIQSSILQKKIQQKQQKFDDMLKYMENKWNKAFDRMANHWEKAIHWTITKGI